MMDPRRQFDQAQNAAPTMAAPAASPSAGAIRRGLPAVRPSATGLRPAGALLRAVRTGSPAGRGAVADVQATGRGVRSRRGGRRNSRRRPLGDLGVEGRCLDHAGQQHGNPDAAGARTTGACPAVGATTEPVRRRAAAGAAECPSAAGARASSGACQSVGGQSRAGISRSRIACAGFACAGSEAEPESAARRQAGSRRRQGPEHRRRHAGQGRSAAGEPQPGRSGEPNGR